ncbi:OHCU decarboxylase [Colletotrichum graminicola]|uniref:OHCU decarboxylase n=1 Tax=Colletotrichum graminicola (strain M1.001 / M2 / FGSC 10212) TaxID=645133 RepID=E3QZ28_COLGM|nr:OHCU decarboxylase [Colletotrichum graminicola M1.001]EFQ36116.1 OHCU decarboxylase [Colletotrichum graminicola M1.001]WDK14876.1 OHCU decarboxylase [Colletotrichum graminicola]
MASLPDASTLTSLSAEEQRRVLDALFEPSPAIHALILPSISAASFQTYDELITHCYKIFEALTADPSHKTELYSIISSHPRLGAKKVESAQSAAEQAQLQSGDATELAALNVEYEAKFPGLRYVVFVNGRGRPEIMENMRERILRDDLASEERAAIQAMCDIARDRAAKLQATSR